MGFTVCVRSAGQKYGPTFHQRDHADITEFVTLVRLSSLGQHVGVLALAGYKRRKSALTAGPIVPWSQDLFIHKSSQLPREHTAQLPFPAHSSNYSNTQAFTVLPGTHLLLGRESACVGKVPCLGAQPWSISWSSQGLNPWSLACKSHMLPLSHDAPHIVKQRFLQS